MMQPKRALQPPFSSRMNRTSSDASQFQGQNPRTYVWYCAVLAGLYVAFSALDLRDQRYTGWINLAFALFWFGFGVLRIVAPDKFVRAYDPNRRAMQPPLIGRAPNVPTRKNDP